MTEQTAGATPVVPDATSGQSTAPTSEETGYPEGLGDAGKKALDAMRLERNESRSAARKAAKELEELRTSLLTEQDKAVAKARTEGATEVATKLQGQIRRAEVKAALTAAGLPSQYLPLAASADPFANLNVNEEGEVEGVDAAVAAFKTAMPALFLSAAQSTARTSFDGGPRGSATGAGGDMNALIRRATGRS